MSHRWKTRTHSDRIAASGFVLVAVLAVLAISLTLFGVWARAAVGQHRRARAQQVRLQAVRLAEAGVRRAIARHKLDNGFTEETWSVPSGVLDRSRAAEVRIRAVPRTNETKLHLSATAEFPLGTLQRARITRQVEIPYPEPRETP